MFLIVGPRRHGSSGYWLYDKLCSQYSVKTLYTRIDDLESPSKEKVLYQYCVKLIFNRL